MPDKFWRMFMDDADGDNCHFTVNKNEYAGLAVVK